MYKKGTFSMDILVLRLKTKHRIISIEKFFKSFYIKIYIKVKDFNIE